MFYVDVQEILTYTNFAQDHMKKDDHFHGHIISQNFTNPFFIHSSWTKTISSILKNLLEISGFFGYLDTLNYNNKTTFKVIIFNVVVVMLGISRKNFWRTKYMKERFNIVYLIIIQ